MTTSPIKITHHCDECGGEIAYDAEGCDEHPGSPIVSVATPAIPGTARLTERKREHSRCCDVAGAVDLELELQVAGCIDGADLGAVGRIGTVRITLVPDPAEPDSYRPYGDSLDVWLSDDGIMARIPPAVRKSVVTELANWLGDERRVIDLDLGEAQS